jgi:hypothetical protein
MSENSTAPYMSLTTRVYAQATANYVASQLSVWEIDFPGGATNDNIN